MCECDGIICPYKSKCVDYNKCCNSCLNNTGKKSYYAPDISPWIPVYPNPYTPWWGTTTFICTTTQTSYYKKQE